MKNVLFVLFGVIAGFLLAGVLVFVARRPAGQPIVLESAPTTAPLEVHVIGAVPRPGLYKFPDGARIQDAVEAAGGLLASADENALNLAAPLIDGQQLDVPYKAGSEPSSSESGPVLPQSTSEVTANELAGELININTATAAELDTLPGIGPTTAKKIIDYRDENGPFATIEDIQNVSGIGPATFDEIKDLITV